MLATGFEILRDGLKDSEVVLTPIRLVAATGEAPYYTGTTCDDRKN